MSQNPIFTTIERCCKECVTEPKIDTFVSLKNIINNANYDVLEPIQKYITFPLHNVLNNSTSCLNEALVIEVCLCLMGLFEKKIIIKTFEQFADVYINLFVIIDDHLRSEKGLKPVTEDLKMVVVETVYNLIKTTPDDVMEECFTHEVFHGAIANSVGTLLRIIKEEKSKSLKISGIKTLEIMMKRNNVLDVEIANGVEKSKGKNQLFFSLLPGITISIMNLITSDDKHPHALIFSSLETLFLAIQLSFPHSSRTSPPSQEDDKISSQTVKNETALKLKVALSKVIDHLIANPSFRIRLALIKFVNDIFFKCDATLVGTVSESIIDVPLTYSCDADTEVRSNASWSLPLMFKSCPRILTYIQDVIIIKLLHSCKRLRQNIDDLSSEEKVIQFKFLTGIFRSFPNQTFFQVPKNRNDVMRTLTHVSKFKQKPSISLVDVSNDENLNLFQYLESSEEVNSLKELVKAVSSSCDQQMLVDYLIGNLSTQHFNESFAYISLEMLRSFDCELPNDILEIFQSWLEEEVTKNVSSAIRLELSIDGVNIWASKSGANNESKLLPIIFTILKFERKEIQLSILSKQLGYESVDDMIWKNLSYFCAMFEEEMNTKHLSICSLVLLRNLIAGSSCNERFDIFETSIDILLQILDLNYNKSARIPLQMLFSFTDSMSKQFSVERIKVNNEHPASGKSQPSFCFKSSWTEYLQTVAVLENVTRSCEQLDPLDEKENSDVNDERVREKGNKSDHMNDSEREKDEKEGKKGLPVHLMIAKKVLERSANLLTLPDPEDRSLILDIISNCVQILSVEENELLPLVHKMWSSLVNRLSDEIPIAKKAFQLVLLLSSTCGDFVYRRINSDVFPKIIPFLNNHVSDGVKSRTRHPFTLVYRLQIDAITGIGTLAVGIGAQGKSLWSLINMLLPYFSHTQPPALMEAAQKSLQKLKSLDSDAVWYYSKKRMEKVSNQDKILIEKLNEISFE